MNFFCLCKSGFTGAQCQQTIDSCQSITCLNSGICISQSSFNSTGTSFCICPFGYSGSRCESKLDACSLQNRCINGGTCVNVGTNSLSCACSIGFTGANCEVQDSCFSSPCRNNGLCLTLFPQGFQWYETLI